MTEISLNTRVTITGPGRRPKFLAKTRRTVISPGKKPV